MTLKTYFDCAENDYQYFVSSCERKDVANIMGAIAQGICEKYMKSLIEQFDHPEREDVSKEQEEALSTHNLMKLSRYIKETLGVSFSYDTREKMKAINGYYLSMRYPGYFLPDLTSQDIERCLDVVQSCRRETLGLIGILEKKNEKPKLADKIEAAQAISEAQNKANARSATKEKEREI